MLAVGLPTPFTYTRIFPPSQRRDRQLRDRHHRVLHVSACSRSCSTRRYVILHPFSRPVSLIPLGIDQHVIADARRIAGEPEDSQWVPTDPRDLANRVFHTCYMGTENSSVETRKRAKELAEAIGRCVLPSFFPTMQMHSMKTD